MKSFFQFYVLTPIGTLQLLFAAASDNQAPITHHFDEPRSVRNVLVDYDLINHLNAQWRTGMITTKEKGNTRLSAYATGGHLHLDTKRYKGITVGASLYGVIDLGFNQDDARKHPDFFDADKQGFLQLSEAYLDGKWNETNVRLGRQTLDTPHADSDDVRMIPNFFEAYRLSDTHIPDTTLQLGYIRKMSGWENGVDASEFVRIDRVLGTNHKTDGVYFANIGYEGIKRFNVDAWFYRFDDVADIAYLEASYIYDHTPQLHVVLGAQYDNASTSGAGYLGDQDANTWGISVEIANEAQGWHFFGAYNKDTSQTGASAVYLGGGALFTSMEELTLDAVEKRAEAWTTAWGYHIDTSQIGTFDIAAAYGQFRSDDRTYDAEEIDIGCSYAFNDTLQTDAVYARITFNDATHTDYDLFRLIVNYNF